MRCEAAQLAISAEMDEHTRAGDAVRTHVEACPRCSAFSRGAWRLRETARFEVAPPVPDLVPAIMAKVRNEAAPEVLRRPPRRPGYERRLGRARPGRAAALAVAAGFVIGFVLTAGGLVPKGGPSSAALAQEIPRRLVEASSTLQGYRARFDITELHWAPAVPKRAFVVDLAFRSPEMFRVAVRDMTRYPSEAWAANDLLLVTDGRRWREQGANPCPVALLPACPRSPTVRTVRNRAPFDAQTEMPTDIVVPMTVLAASDRVRVIGNDTVGGRDAVAVALAYEDATPLFTYLRFLGSWREFYPQDRVVLWLDRATWFPLKYAVFPSAERSRAEWAAGMGFPPEGPGTPVFMATARSLIEQVPASAEFRVPSGGAEMDQGFRDASLRSVDTVGPDAAMVPGFRDGLRLVRFGAFQQGPGRPYRESIAALASGLSWLTVARVTGWHQGGPFGVGPFAEEVGLGNDHGVAYYEPATLSEPRRVSLHTDEGEFLVASNLPRADLLRITSSLPVTGLEHPPSWRIHRWSGGSVESGLSVDAALARTRFQVLLPDSMPSGYRAVAAETVHARGSTGLIVVFRRPAAELGGEGLRLYQAEGQRLPPPTGADQQEVEVRGLSGRWSPQVHMLEWVEGGVYRSLSGTAFDLPALLRTAGSLHPASPEGGSA